MESCAGGWRQLVEYEVAGEGSTDYCSDCVEFDKLFTEEVKGAISTAIQEDSLRVGDAVVDDDVKYKDRTNASVHVFIAPPSGHNHRPRRLIKKSIYKATLGKI